jgi:hypothetical protein
LGANFELEDKDSIHDCFKALQREDDPVHFIVAPRRDLNADDPIQRLCKVVEIDVGGVFAGEYSNANKLAEALGEKKRSKEGLTIGTLINADYRTIFRKFMSNFEAGSLETREVSTYRQAVKWLRDGTIDGCIGHKIFIENCDAEIKGYLGSKRITDSERDRLGNLHMAPENSFDCVKMDIFINTRKIDPNYRATMRTAIGMIYEVIKLINNPPKDDNGVFFDKVSALLKLTKAPKSGKHVMNEFKFEMKTFVTPTLLELWQG